MASRHPIERVQEQVSASKTAMAERAVVLLVFQTHDCSHLERWLHQRLNRAAGSLGTEWFETNPDHLLKLFRRYLTEHPVKAAEPVFETPVDPLGHLSQVVCGVCGNLHLVDLSQRHFVCPREKREYQLLRGTVRAISSRANGKDRRHYRLRWFQNESEQFTEWVSPTYPEVEARGGDEFVLALRNKRVAAFHNLTIHHYFVFNTAVPRWIMIAIGIFVFIALMAIVWANTQ